MVQRHLVIERLPQQGKQTPTRVRLHIDDQTPIGPWITTLAAHFGYPLVDHFGTPTAYRLRSLTGELLVLPLMGRFTDVRFSDGTCFVLELDTQRTRPIPPPARSGGPRISGLPLSRRSLISGGLLTGLSVLGFGSGMTTAFAQQQLRRERETASHPPTASSPVSLALQMTFAHHHQPVNTLSWAPDESAVVSGGDDNLALVCKLDGTILQMRAFPAPVRALAWSPDGGQIVAGAANAVTFFDAHTGTRLAEHTEQHTEAVTALGWTQTSPPCALSAGADTRAVVWNGQTHQPLVVFQQHTTAIEALAILAETVATASQGGIVRVWRALSGQEIHGFYAASPRPLRALAFSSLEALATGGDDGIVSLWNDGRTCTQQHPAPFGMQCVDTPARLPAQNHPIRALAFSPDGTTLATGGEDKHLLLWSVSTRTPLLVHPLPETLAALAWSPSGQWLAGACGSQVLIWHMHL